MRQVRLVVVALVLTLGWVAGAWGEQGAKSPSPARVRAQAEEAVAVRAQTQKQIDAAARGNEALLDKIETLEAELKALSAQRKKTEVYIASQRAKIAGMKRRLEEMEKVSQGLEPLLDSGLIRLGQMVDQDLAFLRVERKTRLDSLKKALGDYDLSLSSKTRRLLEALAVEAGYGHRVGVTLEEVEIQGRLTRVRLVRLGRLALFALSSGGQEAWRWDQNKKGFVPLDGWARELGLMADIAERKRVIDLVEVPLGRKVVGGER